MVGVEEALTAGLISSQWVIVKVFYCIYLWGSRWISWQHTRGIVRIHFFFLNPIEFEISTGFLGICQNYTTLQRITTMFHQEIEILFNLSEVRKRWWWLTAQETNAAVFIIWTCSISLNINGSRHSWKTPQNDTAVCSDGNIQNLRGLLDANYFGTNGPPASPQPQHSLPTEHILLLPS